jgi:hypothetical protein
LQGGLRYRVPANTFIGREFLVDGDLSGGAYGWTTQVSLAADSLIPGRVYTILDPGATDFTVLGAQSNLPGTAFTATGTAAVGTVNPGDIAADAMTLGVEYTVLTQGSTNFLVLGSGGNSPGSVFTYNGAPTAQGTVNAISAVREQGWVAVNSATGSTGSGFTHASDLIPARRIPVTGGESLTIWAMLRAQPGSSGSFDPIQLDFYDAGGVAAGQAVLSEVGFPTTWTYRSATVTVPALAVTAGVKSRESGAAGMSSGVVFLHAIGIRRANTEIFSDPDFSTRANWQAEGLTAQISADPPNAYMANSYDGTRRYTAQVQKGSTEIITNVSQFPCLVGESLRVLSEFRPDGAGSVPPQIQWFSASDLVTPFQTQSVFTSTPSTGQWNQLSADVTVPAGADFARVLLAQGNATAFDWFVGSVQILRLAGGVATAEVPGEVTLPINGDEVFSAQNVALGMVLRTEIPDLYAVRAEVVLLTNDSTAGLTAPSVVIHPRQQVLAKVEYDEYLRPVYGLEALSKRVSHRLSTYIGEIAYYSVGIPNDVFQLDGFAVGALRALFADIDPSFTVDTTRGRIVSTNLRLSVSISPTGLSLGKA